MQKAKLSSSFSSVDERCKVFRWRRRLDSASINHAHHRSHLHFDSADAYKSNGGGGSDIVIITVTSTVQGVSFILDNSQVTNARFQAAAAIRDAAIREWGFLSTEDRRSLISFCLCFVMQHASSPEGYAQAKVSSVAAQLMKRG
ncbi:hypothetical protein CRYUN_Cryun09bG0200900 [Craigia yunnanensis]